jgi:carbonic anhydrase/acetyltransferase-like protein (isoleucine patch superfamily)
MKTNTQFTVTPVAEMVDIVIKGAYVYVSGKDQMTVQVRSVKADTNEILVQELDGKLNLIKDARFTVRLHELYSADELEMHNNGIVAKSELHKAYATLSRRAKEDEKWKRRPNTLNNPERLKAQKALAKARQAYEVASDFYAEIKGQEDGRFNVLETIESFNLTKLEELIAEHEGKANIDDGIDVSRTIKLFDLINMCKIVEIAEQAMKYSPDDEHTLALRQAMYHLRMSSTWRTDHRFVTIWHEVFGGQVQDHQKPGALKQVNAKEVVLKAFDKKTNTISYPGKRVVGIARRWIAAEMAIANEAVATFEEKSLVLVDSRFIKLKHHKDAKDVVTIALRDAGKKIGYTNQILCIRVRKNDEDSCKASLVSDEGMSTLQKLIGLHTTGIQLEGLKNHADFNSVVRCRFTKNDKWANAELLVDPFERMVESTTPEGRAISVLLAELGYGPCIKADSYEKHGYVQLTSTYLTNVGAFGKDGKTCEDIAKLLARYTKQVMNTGYAQFPDMKTVVFGLVDQEVTNLPNDVDTKALERFNNSLARGFVAGQSCASKKAFAYMGTGRYVTGSDDEGTGQKTMVCENGCVYGDACVFDYAFVYGNARVLDKARVSGNAEVYGNACILGNAQVTDNVRVTGNAYVSNNAQVSDSVYVYGNTYISNNAQVCGKVRVYGDAKVTDNAYVYGDVQVCGNANVAGDVKIDKTKNLIVIGPIGSRNGYTTFIKEDNGIISVSCGCFRGTIDAFKKAVLKTHDKDSIHRKKYLSIIKATKYFF